MTAAAVAPAYKHGPKWEDLSQWVVRESVPVFDEHDDFTEVVLAKIAENNNRRESETGDSCPITLGHTMSGVPEKDQPPIIGYARNFKVGAFGQGKKGILADFFIHKAHAAEAATYPRRSVELWPDELFFDPISLLRRTPRRDLGLLTFQKGPGHRQKLRYAMEDSTMGGAVPYLGDEGPQTPPVGGGMTSPMGMGAGMPAMGGVGLSPEEEKLAEKFMAHYMATNPLMQMLQSLQAAGTQGVGQPAGMGPPATFDAGPGGGAGPSGGPAMPGPNNTYLPSANTRKTMSQNAQPDAAVQYAKAEEVVKMQKDLANTQEAYAKLQNSWEDLSKRLGEEQKARQEWEKKYYAKEREASLKKLQDDGGYKFDLDDEVAYCADMTSEQFAKHQERIKKLYARDKAPVGGGPIPFGRDGTPKVGPNGQPQDLTADEAAKARRHALDKGIDYAKARAELFPGR